MVFDGCYDFLFDGGTRQSGKKLYRTGNWVLREWPAPGGVMAQSNLVYTILAVIADERRKIDSEK